MAPAKAAYAATGLFFLFLPLGFQRGTHPAKIPLKARRRSEDRNKEVEQE
jgi:hypothetical protein